METNSPEIAIRRGKKEDVAQVLRIIASARRYMRACGNMTQWAANYPGEHDILSDIENGNLYIGETDDGTAVMAFTFILGDDPTYSHIDGKWENDDPYGTIHRLASDGRTRGALSRCVEFCRTLTNNLRVDTHRDNKPMLRALADNGFRHCGVIICTDGTPREAFQLALSKRK